LFGDFVVPVCYGNSASREPAITQHAQASLYQTGNMKLFLLNSRLPPRCAANTGACPVAGRKIIDAFMFSAMQEVFRKELSLFSKDQTITDEQLANMDDLERITSTTMYNNVKKKCPNLLSMLANLTGKEIEEDEEDKEEEGDEGNTFGSSPPPKKHPYFVSNMSINSFVYLIVH
jgi:hypothetical protein